MIERHIAEYVCLGCGWEGPEATVSGGGHLVAMPTEWTLTTGLPFDHCGPVEKRLIDGDEHA